MYVRVNFLVTSWKKYHFNCKILCKPRKCNFKPFRKGYPLFFVCASIFDIKTNSYLWMLNSILKLNSYLNKCFCSSEFEDWFCSGSKQTAKSVAGILPFELRLCCLAAKVLPKVAVLQGCSVFASYWATRAWTWVKVASQCRHFWLDGTFFCSVFREMKFKRRTTPQRPAKKVDPLFFGDKVNSHKSPFNEAKDL